MSKEFFAKGVVYGKLWGGGYGAYPSRELEAKTKSQLLKKATAELKSGGLDSGMGFNGLKGAMLNIETIETIIVKGKTYKRSEFTTEFIGDLTDKEQDFLSTVEF